MIFQPVKKTYIYTQIANQIRCLIASQKLSKGDMLPTYREIANLLEVSIPSVKRAVSDLTVTGLLVSGRGRKVRINEPITSSE